MDGQFHLLFNPLLWTWSLWWAINWCSYLFISPGWMIPLLPRLFMLNDEFSIWTIKSICFFLMDDQATSEVSPSLFKCPFLSSGPTSSTALGKDSLVWIPVILCPSLSLLPHSFFVHPTCKSCSVVSTSSHLTPQQGRAPVMSTLIWNQCVSADGKEVNEQPRMISPRNQSLILQPEERQSTPTGDTIAGLHPLWFFSLFLRFIWIYPPLMRLNSTYPQWSFWVETKSLRFLSGFSDQSEFFDSRACVFSSRAHQGWIALWMIVAGWSIPLLWSFFRFVLVCCLLSSWFPFFLWWFIYFPHVFFMMPLNSKFVVYLF